MRLGLTEKFLAEGQPEPGKNGHVLAAVSHRCAEDVVMATTSKHGECKLLRCWPSQFHCSIQPFQPLLPVWALWLHGRSPCMLQ